MIGERLRREAPALVLELLLLALILVLEGFLFVHALPAPADYDEGVYLAAVDAFRHGQELGSEIFTAQPPGFYWLLTALDGVFGDSLAGVRDGIIALALVACVGAYLVGRATGGPIAGLGAALLLGVSPPFPTFASRISADLPGVAIGLLGLGAFVAALRRGRSRPLLCSVAGVLLAFAVVVKLSALVLLAPFVGFALVRRMRSREVLAFLAGVGAVAAGVVLANLGELDGLWRGVVSYHTAARDVPGPGVSDNFEQIRTLFDWRTPLTWLVGLAVVVSLVGLARARVPLWPLWLLVVVSVGLLLWQKPLHDNHKVLLAVVLPVAAGAALGATVRQLTGASLAAAGVVLAAAVVVGYAKEWRRLDRNQGPQPAEIRWAARQLEARTSPRELVVSDQPVVPFFADRRVPGELVDTAVLRFQAGYLTDAEVLRVIRTRRVRAVVAARAFEQRPKLLAALRERFPRRIVRGGTTIYLRGTAASR